MKSGTEGFKARFGKKIIPDNILVLFFEDEKYSYVLNHKIGRELVVDLFFRISEEIKAIVESELKSKKDVLDTLKQVATCLSEQIKEHGSESLELKPDLIKEEEWNTLWQKCYTERTQQEFNNRRRIILNGNIFNSAIKSELGTRVVTYIQEKINMGYRDIWESNHEPDGSGLQALDIYKQIKAAYYKKGSSYTKELESIYRNVYGGRK